MWDLDLPKGDPSVDGWTIYVTKGFNLPTLATPGHGLEDKVGYARIEVVRASECSRCIACGYVQAEPNWCHECGGRVTFPAWAVDLMEELDTLRQVRDELETENEDLLDRLADT